jgi:hypothetical protein
VHFYAAYEAAKARLFPSTWVVARDFGGLLCMPIPDVILELVSKYQRGWRDEAPGVS